MNTFVSGLYKEFVYGYSIPVMLLWGVLLTAFWLACAVLITRAKRGRGVWIWINRLMLFFTVVFILWYTVFNRSSGKHQISPIPFYSFKVAQKSPGRYRSVVANFLLFVPFGLSMPYVLKQPLIPGSGVARHPIRNTIITAALFSAAIELTQLIFRLGMYETDDIIFNTAGAAFGTLAFAVYERLSRKKRHKPTESE